MKCTECHFDIGRYFYSVKCKNEDEDLFYVFTCGAHL